MEGQTWVHPPFRGGGASVSGGDDIDALDTSSNINPEFNLCALIIFDIACRWFTQTRPAGDVVNF